jgi:hypothetical protein
MAMAATRVCTSSQHGRREVCAACGTGLFFRNDDSFAGLVDVLPATRDDPDAFAPTEQIQIAERIGRMAGADLLPAFERCPPIAA